MNADLLDEATTILRRAMREAGHWAVKACDAGVRADAAMTRGLLACARESLATAAAAVGELEAAAMADACVERDE